MKAHLKSSNGRLLVEIEAATVKDLFQEIAEVQEILDADPQCGACRSSAIKFKVREVKSFKYYELACETCNARLSFGQLREGGGLFPKRFDLKRRPLANRGWLVYLPEGGQ